MNSNIEFTIRELLVLEQSIRMRLKQVEELIKTFDNIALVEHFNNEKTTLQDMYSRIDAVLYPLSTK
jgi:hypothetical protein